MGYVELIDLHYTLSGKTKSQRINFYHMPLPYAVLALMKAKSTENDLICSIVSRLIKEHQYGRWYHPYLPDTLTMWSMYDVLNLFKEFKDSKYYTNYDQFYYIEPNQPKVKFDVIIFTVVPIEFKTLNSILNFADPGRSEDYKTNGFWYYKYTLRRDGKSSLSCLITMIGSAGDVDCSIACNNAFSIFDCDLAILCGIAAGNKNEITKYSSVVAENVVAYEYQRWEEDGRVYRPKHYQVKGAVKRGIEKVALFDKQFISILSTFLKRININFSEVENYSPENVRNHVGVIASGAKLLADGRTLQILRENISVGKGIIAAEMEGSGFAPACEAKDVDWLIFRGVSDYGEDDKNNPENKAYQPLAVASAAASMICYLTYVYER
jgi:nucleoside phosphorylase